MNMEENKTIRSVRKVYAVYFSPTKATAGLTRFMAEKIAAQAGVAYECYDYTLPEARKKELCFSEDELVVLGNPVYAGRTPNRMLPYLKSIQGNKTPVVLLAVYGNRAYEDALTEMRNVLSENGFVPVAAVAAVSSHPMSRVFGSGALGKGRPDQKDLEKIAAFAKQISDMVLKTGFEEKKLELPGNDEVGAYYKPVGQKGQKTNFLKVVPSTNEKCTKCKACVAVCPEGAIDASDPSVVSGVCIKCLACVEVCPQHAKYFTDENLISHSLYLEETFSDVHHEVEFYSL